MGSNPIRGVKEMKKHKEEHWIVGTIILLVLFLVGLLYKYLVEEVFEFQLIMGFVGLVFVVYAILYCITQKLRPDISGWSLIFLACLIALIIGVFVVKEGFFIIIIKNMYSYFFSKLL